MSRRLPASLQTRILLLVGSVVLVLMMAFSFVLLYNWQRTTLLSERRNVLTSTRAFSVAVRDALMQKENDLLPTEGYLDNYVANFLSGDPRIRFIAIYDGSSELLAFSGAAGGDLSHVPAISLELQNPATITYKHPDYGWVVEAVYPILTAKKRWGTVRLAIEAESIRNQMYANFNILVVLSAIVTLILLLLLHYLISRIMHSLQDFVEVMDHTTLISRPGEEPGEARDEIGVLHKHFHSLQVRLQQSQKKLNQAQQQVFHAERLASIGRLSAGIAHEINNPINGIKSCLFALRQGPVKDEMLTEYLDLIDDGVEHVSGVVQKLLNFGRREISGMETVDLNAQIRSVAEFLTFSLRDKGILFEMDLAENLPAINANNQLIQEVYINLIMNSIDAVPKGGTISVMTTYDGKGWIVSRVRDYGTGIPTDQIQQIFDPFFTTKEIGKGTGLGLSVSLGIVHSLGGTIDVMSEEGVHTTFTLTFPVVTDDENPAD